MKKSSTTTTTTATATAIPTIDTFKDQLTMARLANEIINLTERKKEIETLLEEAKKQMGAILPESPNEFIVACQSDPTKKILARWTEKQTRTLQRALVEEHHGITLTEDDFKVTDSKYVEVKKIKA